jgi:hypothetical protein
MKSIITSSLILLALVHVSSQNTLSVTYQSGDIPTSFNTYDNSCNGNSATITVTLPAGDNYEVTSVDVNYTMISIGANFKSHQRSKVRFSNNGMEEAEIAGVGDVAGSQSYARTYLLANGIYPGSTPLTFEMHARRTVEGNAAGCNTSTVRVDAFTWTITVHYSNQIVNPKAGVNRTNPQAALHVNGRVRVGEETTVPVAGSIRYNTSKNDFEGFNGSEWISFTDKVNNGGWGNQNAIENSSVTNTDTQADDNFGTSVDVHLDYAIVGSPRKNVGANADQGRVYVLNKSTNGAWIQNATLNASDGAANDSFGYSVAIFGNYAVVGAPNKDIGGNLSQGKAYVFFRTSSNTWTQQAILTASDGGNGDKFGSSVAIDGDYIIVGAPHDKVGSNESQGSAYIFVRDGTSWTEQSKLVATGGLANAHFGNSVSIDGFYAAIGSKNDPVSGFIGRGSAYVFKRSGTSWAQQTKLIATDGGTNHNFGSSVSIDSTTMIVGAENKPNNDISNGAQYGKVYIYTRTSNTWSQNTTIIHPNGEGFDHFGSSVALHGNILIVGAPDKNIGNNNDQGMVFLYEKNGTVWTLTAQMAATDGSSTDRFGASIAVDGNNVMVGAPLKDTGSSANEGKVYFFNK